MCIDCECQELDCDNINIDEIVGILLFEKVDKLSKPEYMQIKDLCKHIGLCEDCNPRYNNLIDDALYGDEDPDDFVFKNFAENLYKLKGQYVHPPIIIDKNELQ